MMHWNVKRLLAGLAVATALSTTALALPAQAASLRMAWSQDATGLVVGQFLLARSWGHGVSTRASQRGHQQRARPVVPADQVWYMPGEVLRPGAVRVDLLDVPWAIAVLFGEVPASPAVDQLDQSGRKAGIRQDADGADRFAGQFEARIDGRRDHEATFVTGRSWCEVSLCRSRIHRVCSSRLR